MTNEGNYPPGYLDPYEGEEAFQGRSRQAALGDVGAHLEDAASAIKAAIEDATLAEAWKLQERLTGALVTVRALDEYRQTLED